MAASLRSKRSGDTGNLFALWVEPNPNARFGTWRAHLLKARVRVVSVMNGYEKMSEKMSATGPFISNRQTFGSRGAAGR